MQSGCSKVESGVEDHPPVSLLAEDLAEVEERILGLWSMPGASWFRVSEIAREVGVFASVVESRLGSMEERGLLRRIHLNHAGYRYNAAPAGLALNAYLRGLYGHAVAEVC